jgi:hypothetical protein
MIECRLLHLEARCLERGYTLNEARACIVSQDGDRIVVDELHPAYPKKRPHPQRDQGPGAELKALLRRYLRIVTKPGCKCNTRARMMDERGCQWCLDNLDEIVGWLQEEHTRQKILLPFVPLAAKQLVKLAVRNAKKKGTCR